MAFERLGIKNCYLKTQELETSNGRLRAENRPADPDQPLVLDGGGGWPGPRLERARWLAPPIPCVNTWCGGLLALRPLRV